MLSKMFAYFRDEEDNDPSFIRLVRNIVVFVLLVNIALLPLVTGFIGEGSRNPPAFITLTITLVLEVISLLLLFRGKVGMAKAVVPFALIAAVTIISLNTNGLKNASMVGMPIVLVISAILLGKRSIYLTAPVAIIAVIFVGVVNLRGDIVNVPVGLDDAIILPVLLMGCAGIVQLLITRLNESISRARKSEQIQKLENAELNELRSQLEERVSQRTAELDFANRNNERRAKQFEAIAQVVRVVSSIQDLELLIPRIAQVISEQFGFYHTGIFLLDDEGEYAVLRAANSEGGRRMLDRGHKLQVGQTGIVGFVTATGQPRIALDVGTDAVFFDNPDMPNTRSEIALPLRYAGKIIGALDVQSTEANAFGQNDVETLTTLADQISIAINNTTTLEEARKAFAESQSRFGDTVIESWKVMQPESMGLGYQLVNSSLKPLEKPLEGSHIQEALAQDKTILSTTEDKSSALAIPIRLRGKMIGIMHLRSKNNYLLTQDDADIAEAVSERLSLAIETATLLRTTQHRADIERVTADISSKISSSTHFDAILQITAQELSKALGGSDVLVQIEPVSMELGMSS
ncbi:GAF domain-containing protein [Candidatus Villigracilis affinis]|uniref:GAF domain-containing protein n=1 Tax=Candidatus Villigracilis affinis TaxID=3140682 RepID=UPI001E17F2D6|nr:GAF domain-containing protein [Anaerolineales bacterium]